MDYRDPARAYLVKNIYSVWNPDSSIDNSKPVKAPMGLWLARRRRAHLVDHMTSLTTLLSSSCNWSWKACFHYRLSDGSFPGPERGAATLLCHYSIEKECKRVCILRAEGEKKCLPSQDLHDKFIRKCQNKLGGAVKSEPSVFSILIQLANTICLKETHSKEQSNPHILLSVLSLRDQT